MRAAHAAGFRWCSGTLDQQVIEARRHSRYTYVCLYTRYESARQYVYVENPEQAHEALTEGTLVNSPAHWIAYANRHFSTKP